MGRYTRTVVLLVVATLVIATAPAAAGASHSLKATFDAEETLYANFAPDDVAARCPEDSGWIFGAEPGVGNTGTMTIGHGDPIDFTFEFNHCSRWVAFNPERPTGRQVGKAAAGEMTIATADGSLELEYSGTWVLQGALPDFTADLNLSYTVVGGDGEFADASGHGQLSMTVGPFSGTGRLIGSLK